MSGGGPTSLPDCRVEWAEKLSKCGGLGPTYGTCHVHGFGNCRPPCTGHVIQISRRIKPFTSFVDGTLLHEMVHLSAAIRMQAELLNHGWFFQKEMKRLAAAGAFEWFW